MKKYLLNPLVLILIVIVGAYITHALRNSSPAPSQPGMPASTPPGQRPRVAVLPFGIKPTSDKQQADLDKIDDKYRQKIWEARESLNNVLTPQQKLNRQAAFQKALKEGKQGKDLGDAVDKAIGMTTEQRENLLKSQQQLNSVTSEMVSEILGLLTEAQKKEIDEKRRQLSKNQPAPQKPAPTKAAEKNKTKSESGKKAKADTKKK